MSASNSASPNGSASARPSRSSIRSREPGALDARAAGGEHLRALVDPDDRARRALRARARSRRRPCRSRRRARASRPAGIARDEERAPARVLPEREQPRVAVVRRPERREQLARVARPRETSARPESMLGRVALSDDLERIAAPRPRRSRRRARSSPACSPPSRSAGRVYLCAYARRRAARLARARRRGAPVDERARWCAKPPRSRRSARSRRRRAGGGDLPSCARGSPSSARREAPEGIEEAEAAAAALARTLEPEPRLATTDVPRRDRRRGAAARAGARRRRAARRSRPRCSRPSARSRSCRRGRAALQGTASLGPWSAWKAAASDSRSGATPRI